MLDRISAGVVAIRADVGLEAEAVRMVEEAEAGLGGIDIFVSNAGAAWHETGHQDHREAFYKTLEHQPGRLRMGRLSKRRDAWPHGGKGPC